MKNNQIYALLNSVFKQATGQTTVVATDLTGVVQMGDTVLSSNDNKSAFMGALIDRVTKTILSNRPYNSRVKGILKDLIEYGAIVQKITFRPIDVKVDDTWNIKNGFDMSTTLANIPEVVQKLFTNQNVWALEYTTLEKQMETAFTSLAELTAFFSGVYTMIENSIELAVENLVNITLCNYIAEKQLAEDNTTVNGVHVVNLLQIYHDIFDVTLTPEKALYDIDFLKFATARMMLYIDQLSTFSQIFNTEGEKRHTPKDRMNFYLNSYLDKTMKSYLQSDVYHKELVTLEGYIPNAYWQGLGLTGSFEETTKIDIKTSDGVDVTMNYVVGFMFDTDALGVTIEKMDSNAQFFPKVRGTQNYHYGQMGVFNDMSENAIVFTMAPITP